MLKDGLLTDLFYQNEGYSQIELPSFERLISDCAKLKKLDELLAKLAKENHRVLIFCQMTRMIDILEEYMSKRRYTYFRMDGSTNIADRRDMVNEFQVNDKIFAFLLSTRAGGLGVNLTGADTVIFYDNDWNPTMDAQATDRAHRIGQTKKVTVYRLTTKDTIEERILKRAKQKQNVQTTVYAGGAFKADIFKQSEIVELLYSEEEVKKMEAERKKLQLEYNSVNNIENTTDDKKKKKNKKDSKSKKKDDKEKSAAKESVNNSSAQGKSIPRNIFSVSTNKNAFNAFKADR
jgi:DNA helicase INO80